MPKYISDRKRNLNLGISNHTEGSDVLSVTGNTRLSGIVTAITGVAVTYFGSFTGDVTGIATGATRVYIDESEDDNHNYNIVFSDHTPSSLGDAYHTLQVDNSGLTFNPGLNIFSVLRAQAPGYVNSSAYYNYNNTNTNINFDAGGGFQFNTENTTRVKIGTDGNTFFTGGLNVVGISTFQSHVHLGDDDEIKLGNGDDLRIYHDGSNSYIHDDGAGKLRLCSNTTQIRNANDNADYALFSSSGFEIYRSGSKALETIGAGLTVYGDLYATDINGSSNVNIAGVVTATGGFNIGISSGGTTITSGPITALNFVGTGNTFSVNGTTVDVSISGGGGASVSIGTEAPSSPSAGDLWYNNEKARTFIYYDEAEVGTGSAAFWVDSSPFVLPATDPDPVAAKTSATFTAEANQYVFTFAHTVGFIDVYLNGIRLSPSEFTSDGASVTLGAGASAGDVVDLVQYRMGIGATGPQGPAGGKWGTFSINTGITTTVKVQIQNNLEVTGVTTSTGGFSGTLTGNVTGNLTGNVTGSINATGVSTFQSHVHLGDDDELRFGASNDFKIVHDPNDCRFENSNGDIKFKNTGSYFFFDEDGGETLASFINDGAANLFYSGNKKFETTTSGVTVTGDVNSTSDINIKKNIQVIDNAIDKVKAISGVTFQWKENEELSGGVIAQDVMVLLPELVKENDNNIKTVNYNGLVGLLIEVVKDQQNQLDELKTRISELEE